MEGRQKSRTLRRKKTRVPSGKVVVHYVPRNHSRPSCGKCGCPLSGIPRTIRSLANVSKSQKRPERPYGGVLCSKCTRQTIVDRFRGIFSLSKK